MILLYFPNLVFLEEVETIFEFHPDCRCPIVDVGSTPETHAHGDHIAALGAVRAAAPQAKVHSNSRSAPAEQHNAPGATVAVGRLQVTYCETPGHAADGVTYLINQWPHAAPTVAVVGDTIFAGSMGRGNDGWDLARQKVREHILSLPPETLLCPGHGPLTTVGEEQANNPFF